MSSIIGISTQKYLIWKARVTLQEADNLWECAPWIYLSLAQKRYVLLRWTGDLKSRILCYSYFEAYGRHWTGNAKIANKKQFAEIDFSNALADFITQRNWTLSEFHYSHCSIFVSNSLGGKRNAPAFFRSTVENLWFISNPINRVVWGHSLIFLAL